tara:strand:- start:1585 stop:2154 length:570 start_codon:yes stop_codon:yes gene_type:complete
MNFPNTYTYLDIVSPILGEYSLVPIRYKDRIPIMKWRNEQMYHLRQAKPLTVSDQDDYFQNVVSLLFAEEKPKQILFSFLKKGKCVGYGGLVHISWEDKNCELSFIMDTELEQEEFHCNWSIYLKLIEQIAFEQIGLHRIYVYAFDLRPHLYEVLENNGYIREARLKDHKTIQGKFVDVVILGKLETFT